MNLTVIEIKKACNENDYIAMRHSSGDLVGINCKVGRMKLMVNKPNVVTRYQSYKPISFMEYISIKTPFVS